MKTAPFMLFILSGKHTFKQTAEKSNQLLEELENNLERIIDPDAVCGIFFSNGNELSVRKFMELRETFIVHCQLTVRSKERGCNGIDLRQLVMIQIL